MRHHYIFIIILLQLVGCNSKSKTTSENIDAKPIIDTPLIKLDYGFIIEGVDIETYTQYKVLTKMRIKKEDKIIYEYDNVDEFNLDSIQIYLFPRQASNEFDLLFEGTMPPGKSWLNRLLVRGDSVIILTKVPTFEAPPKNLDKDENKEVAGYWVLTEATSLDEDGTTDYNPILYYELTKAELKLDSTLTIKRNIEIYGDFYGFNFSGEKRHPVSILKMFDRELSRINNK